MELWRIATLNVQHQTQSHDLIACAKEHRIDILAITETQFRGKNDPDWDLCGYHVYGQVTQPPEFGVGFIVRSQLTKNRRGPDSYPHVYRVAFPKPRCALLETRQNKVRVTIVAGYAPHSGSSPEDRANFWSNLHACLSMARGRVFLLGDFNAQIPSRVRSDPPNENGEALQLLADSFGLTFSSLSFRKRPSHMWTWRGHIPDRLPRVLDYIMAEATHSNDIQDCEATAAALRTDHRIVIAKISVHWSPQRSPDRTQTLPQLPRPLEESTPEFHQLSLAYAQHQSTLPPQQLQPRKPWLDPSTLSAVREKANSFRLHRQHPTVELWSRYVEARRKASRMVREAWSVYWLSLGQRITHDFQIGNAGRGLATISKLVHQRPRLRPQDELDLKAHADYFQQLFQEDPPAHPHPNCPHLISEPNLPQWNGFPDTVPSQKEIVEAMSLMKDGAPGKDNMRISHLKTDPTLRDKVVALIQQVWVTEVLPPEWTEAVLVPIPKKGRAPEPKDTRPIMLLSVTSKLLTKIIHLRARHIPLLPHQHGFRAGDSTVSAILGVKLLMQQAKKAGLPLCCVFIDLRKAYDCIPRSLLFETLSKYGFPQKIVSLLRALYCDKVYVRLAGHTTESPFPSKHGVRQGCPLSPLLFNIFLDRVLQTALPHMRGVHLQQSNPGNPETESWSIPLTAYADDIVVFGASMLDTQHNVDVLTEALAAAGLTINTDKTQLMRMPDQLPPQIRPPAALPPEIVHLDDNLYFFQMPRKRRAAICCPIPKCGEALANDDTLRKHLLLSHALTVSCASSPPQKLEILPTFARGEDDNGDAFCVCPTCPPTDKKLRCSNRWSPSYINRHWRSCKCHPPGLLGYQWVGANHLPLPRPPPRPTLPPLQQPAEITIYGLHILEVCQYNYLGRLLHNSDDDAPATKARLRIASATFGSLRTRIFKNRATSTQAKLALVRGILQAQVVYAGQTWVVNSHSTQSLRSFQQRSLRHALRLHPTKSPSGELRYPRCEDVLSAANTNDLPDTIQHAQVRFIGHLLRRPHNDQTRRLLYSTLPLPGRQGYADSNLLSTRVLSTLEHLGLATATADDRDKWRAAIEPLLHTFTDTRPPPTIQHKPLPPPAEVPGERPPRKRYKPTSASTVTG